MESEAVVADDHAVGVTAHLVQHILKPAEGRLGVEELLLAAQALDATSFLPPNRKRLSTLAPPTADSHQAFPMLASGDPPRSRFLKSVSALAIMRSSGFGIPDGPEVWERKPPKLFFCRIEPG